MLRSVGKKAALITLGCDILKGIVAILIAIIINMIAEDSTNPAILVQIAALCVVVGHTYPIFFEFRGGKGVATSLGIIILVNWQIGLICLVFALVLIALTRMVSLGSISAAILFAVLTIFLPDHFLVEGNYIIFGILLATLVIFNHRTNIKRIMEGNESRINFKKS